MRRVLFATLTVCLAIAQAACSSGSNSVPTPRPTPTPDLVAVRKDLTDEQLGSVALALVDFGGRYDSFRPSLASGVQTLATRADLACDASRQINTLSKNGWIKAYARFFASPDPIQPETVAIGTNIDVFSSKDGAAAKLSADVSTVADDARSTSGCFGYAIEGVERLAVTGVGDEMWGVRERINIHSLRGSISTVAFRRSNLVAMVEIVRLSSEDSTDELVALAREIDKRIAPLVSSPLSMGRGEPGDALHD